MDLLSKLVHDVQSLVDSLQSPDLKALRRFLGFSNCIAAIARVSAQASKGIFPGRQADIINPRPNILGHLLLRINFYHNYIPVRNKAVSGLADPHKASSRQAQLSIL